MELIAPSQLLTSCSLATARAYAYWITRYNRGARRSCDRFVGHILALEYWLFILLGFTASIVSSVFGLGGALIVLAVGPHILPVKNRSFWQPCFLRCDLHENGIMRSTQRYRGR